MPDQPIWQAQVDRAAVRVDAGFRRWYQACPCCLSHVYPEVKRLLDEESLAESLTEPDQKNEDWHGPGGRCYTVGKGERRS